MLSSHALVVAAHVALGSALALALLPFATHLPNFVVPDDGYFYAQIAFNLGTTGKSSFDGIHTTSGYHLPWAALLASVSALLRFVTVDKTVHLWAYLAVALSLGLATARSFFSTPLFRAAAFVAFVAMFSLTEMALAAPLLLALLREQTRAPSRTERLLAFVLPIVRVDLCVVPLAIALLSRNKRGLHVALVALAGVAVQLIVMKIAFGHWVSVAAWLKATHSLGTLSENLRQNLRDSVFQDGVFFAHAVFATFALALRRDRITWLLVSAALSFLALHAVLSVLRGWYFVPSLLGILYALEHSLRSVTEQRKLARLVHSTVAFLAIAFVIRAIRVEVVYAADQRVSATFLSELRSQLPAGTALYTWDNPGFLGFFSGYPVVDGDGLVNDFDHARRLREGRLAGYLDEERICHVVVDEIDDDPIFEVSGLVLRRSDVRLLYAIRRAHPSQSDFALYRLNTERCHFFARLPLP